MFDHHRLKYNFSLNPQRKFLFLFCSWRGLGHRLLHAKFQTCSFLCLAAGAAKVNCPNVLNYQTKRQQYLNNNMVQRHRLYLIKWLQTQGIFNILGERPLRFQFRWCLCDHIGKLIQETRGIQVLVVSTYGNKISKVGLLAAIYNVFSYLTIDNIIVRVYWNCKCLYRSRVPL